METIGALVWVKSNGCEYPNQTVEIAVVLKVIRSVQGIHALSLFCAIQGVKNISINEITERINELSPNKTRSIVVICHSGNRSSEVTHYLVKQGNTKVHNLASDTSGWVMSGNSEIRRTMKAGAFR
jgi:rhodanese-related sulfurtransferase